jgi:AcrR family transcriptional regulator
MDSRKLDGRRQRSRQTRARIVEAAGRLFIDHGYVTTTIEEIAVAAGVAVQTVYYVFGTKPSLLAAVVDAVVAGDTEPVPVLQRSWVDAIQAEHDATSAMRTLVAGSVAIITRSTPIYEVVRGAAADPDVSALLDDTRRRRRHDQQQLIHLLAQSGHLPANVDRDVAADVLYAVVNEEVFQLLTGHCGWSTAQFQRWATSIMLQHLATTGADPR